MPINDVLVNGCGLCDPIGLSRSDMDWATDCHGDDPALLNFETGYAKSLKSAPRTPSAVGATGTTVLAPALVPVLTSGLTPGPRVSAGVVGSTA